MNSILSFGRPVQICAIFEKPHGGNPGSFAACGLQSSNPSYSWVIDPFRTVIGAVPLPFPELYLFRREGSSTERTRLSIPSSLMELKIGNTEQKQVRWRYLPCPCCYPKVVLSFPRGRAVEAAAQIPT